MVHLQAFEMKKVYSISVVSSDTTSMDQSNFTSKAKKDLDLQSKERPRKT